MGKCDEGLHTSEAGDCITVDTAQPLPALGHEVGGDERRMPTSPLAVGDGWSPLDIDLPSRVSGASRPVKATASVLLLHANNPQRQRPGSLGEPLRLWPAVPGPHFAVLASPCLVGIRTHGAGAQPVVLCSLQTAQAVC